MRYLLALLLLCGTAHGRPKLAVMSLQDDTHSLTPAVVDGITDALRTQLTQSGQFVVIDKSRQAAALKQLVTAQKKESYRACYDSSCQIPLGQALAADSILRTKLTRVGSYDLLMAEMVDLARESVTTAGQTRIRTRPSAGREDRLLAAISTVVRQLTGQASPMDSPPEVARSPMPTPEEMEARRRAREQLRERIRSQAEQASLREQRGAEYAQLLAGCGPRVLFRGEEPGFGAVFVVQQGSQRTLRFGRPDAENQSIYDLARPDHEPLGYVRTALLALAHAGHRRRLLMIGLGGGSYLRHVRRLAPEVALEAVEINPLVVQVCRRYFTLPRGTVVHVMDGRRFVQRTRQRYDVVFIDAYDAVDYPLHLGTRQFFAEVARILAPGGVVVANLSPNTDRTRDDLARTFLDVFPAAICRMGSGNTLLLGRREPGPTGSEVMARIRRLEQKSHGRYGLVRAARRRCVLDLRAARLLQD